MSATLEEHLEYISDPVRTEAVRRAIADAVRPGDVVVDLGCGFGLLGLMCLQAGAARVWGIDQTDAIDIAREVASRASFGERYRCVRGRSFEIDLPEKADLVICDHIGFFGFDYGIVDLLADARRRFLKPGGTIIPREIDLVMAGIASERCRGIGEAWGDPAIPSDFHWLTDYGRNSKHGVSFEHEELATSDHRIASIDLLADASAMINGQAELKASQDGHLDGLGGWFEARLSAAVSMTNSPRDPGAIRRHQVYLPFDAPLPVRTGDGVAVDFKAHHETTILSWSARNLRTGEKRSQTTWRSKILEPGSEAGSAIGVPTLGRRGAARAAVAGLVDGERSAADIERIMLERYPDFLPTESQIRLFVRSELSKLVL